MKRKVAIVTDSTANMPENILEEYGIQVIPLTVNWAGESFLDGVDIQPDEFYKRLQSAKEMPTTSQPSVGQFIEFFQQVAETAVIIVGIFISEALSGTLDSARAAEKELPDIAIEIVDSQSSAMGLALLVSYACRMAADGKDHQEIAEKARQAGVEPRQGSTMVEMIGEDLTLERQQIERYSVLARKIQATDPVTWLLVVQILAQTEKHAAELADFLSRKADVR